MKGDLDSLTAFGRRDWPGPDPELCTVVEADDDHRIVAVVLDQLDLAVTMIAGWAESEILRSE